MSWFGSGERDNTPITLNVGGGFFMTTVASLKPLAKHPLFGPIIRGKAPKVDGAVLIDEDPAVFRYILNYYRTGSLCVPAGFDEWELLCKTVEHLELADVATHIEGNYEYQRYVFRKALPPAVLVQWPTTIIARDEARPMGSSSSGAAVVSAPSPVNAAYMTPIRITPPVPSLDIDESGGGSVRFEGRTLEDVDQLVMVLMAAYGYTVSHWREREGKVFLSLKESPRQ